MKKMLIVIDMQNDFITGALGTPQAVSVVDAVAKKISEYQESGQTIIFTMDTHSGEYLSTQEGRNLPVEHCMKGTEGWELHPQIKKLAGKGQYKVYEKGAFGSDDLAFDLSSGVYAGMEQIELVGVATDICVLTNAILAKTFMPEALIVVDAACCAGVTPQSHQTALAAMKPVQITIVNE